MISSAKRLLQTVAERLGYTVIPNWRLDTYEQAQYLARLLSLLDIDCVIDVGANRGQYRDFLRGNVGYRGNIVSFEPIPEHAQELQRRAKGDPRWVVSGCALGRARGTATFNVMAASEFSSFLPPDHSHVHGLERMNAVARQVDVEVWPLDEWLEDHPELRSPRTYLKLDTQGFDLQVAEGAPRTLETVLALQTEISFKPIYGGMPDFATAIRSFEALGFEPSGLFKIPNHPFPELLEMDCHMIGSRCLGELMARRNALRAGLMRAPGDPGRSP